jgi:hypothetical protein
MMKQVTISHNLSVIICLSRLIETLDSKSFIEGKVIDASTKAPRHASLAMIGNVSCLYLLLV